MTFFSLFSRKNAKPPKVGVFNFFVFGHFRFQKRIDATKNLVANFLSYRFFVFKWKTPWASPLPLHFFCPTLFFCKRPNRNFTCSLTRFSLPNRNSTFRHIIFLRGPKKPHGPRLTFVLFLFSNFFWKRESWSASQSAFCSSIHSKQKTKNAKTRLSIASITTSSFPHSRFWVSHHFRVRKWWFWTIAPKSRVWDGLISAESYFWPLFSLFNFCEIFWKTWKNLEKVEKSDFGPFSDPKTRFEFRPTFWVQKKSVYTLFFTFCIHTSTQLNYCTP